MGLKLHVLASSWHCAGGKRFLCTYMVVVTALGDGTADGGRLLSRWTQARILCRQEARQRS